MKFALLILQEQTYMPSSLDERHLLRTAAEFLQAVVFESFVAPSIPAADAPRHISFPESVRELHN